MPRLLQTRRRTGAGPAVCGCRECCSQNRVELLLSTCETRSFTLRGLVAPRFAATNGRFASRSLHQLQDGNVGRLLEQQAVGCGASCPTHGSCDQAIELPLGHAREACSRFRHRGIRAIAHGCGALQHLQRGWRRGASTPRSPALARGETVPGRGMAKQILDVLFRVPRVVLNVLPVHGGLLKPACSSDFSATATPNSSAIVITDNQSWHINTREFLQTIAQTSSVRRGLILVDHMRKRGLAVALPRRLHSTPTSPACRSRSATAPTSTCRRSRRPRSTSAGSTTAPPARRRPARSAATTV